MIAVLKIFKLKQKTAMKPRVLVDFEAARAKRALAKKATLVTSSFIVVKVSERIDLQQPVLISSRQKQQ